MIECPINGKICRKSYSLAKTNDIQTPNRYQNKIILRSLRCLMLCSVSSVRENCYKVQIQSRQFAGQSVGVTGRCGELVLSLPVRWPNSKETQLLIFSHLTEFWFIKYSPWRIYWVIVVPIWEMRIKIIHYFIGWIKNELDNWEITPEKSIGWI